MRAAEQVDKWERMGRQGKVQDKPWRGKKKTKHEGTRMQEKKKGALESIPSDFG